MNPIAIVLCILLAIVIWLLWQDSRKTKGIRRGGNIDRDLLEAVNGDAKLAERLLEQARFKYPGKSESWYVEKVIYDINRDRGFVKKSKRRRIFDPQIKAKDIFLLGGILWVLNSLMTFIQRLLP
ncbi:MAG: hypothetical protein AB4290_01525 [Spirulina sp.]